MTSGAAPGPLLAAALALLLTSRLRELLLSRVNERALLARGGRRVAGDYFPALAALHAAFFVALPLEAWLAATRTPAWWPLCLAVWVLAEALRAASMRALRDRWTARVVVVPGEPRVRAGLYRLLAHPNYVGAALEPAAVALLFGAWRTALVATAVNAALLTLRARVESRALEAAEREAPIAPSAIAPPAPGVH